MEIVERAGRAEELVLVAEYPEAGLERVWAYWTRPERLVRWWPREVETDVRDGGAYHLAWPEQGWHLRGHYTAVVPERLLAFTWAWDGEPQEGAAPKQVTLRFEPLPGGTAAGTHLTLTHGTYADTDEDREARQHHLDGWRHFLPRLGEALRADTGG